MLETRPASWQHLCYNACHAWKRKSSETLERIAESRAHRHQPVLPSFQDVRELGLLPPGSLLPQGIPRRDGPRREADGSHSLPRWDSQYDGCGAHQRWPQREGTVRERPGTRAASRKATQRGHRGLRKGRRQCLAFPVRGHPERRRAPRRLPRRPAARDRRDRARELSGATVAQGRRREGLALPARRRYRVSPCRTMLFPYSFQEPTCAHTWPFLLYYS